MMNSSRPAFSIAAMTPTPWSSSWFHRKSICGAACSRFAACSSPDSTVNSAATRLSTFWSHSASASLKPWLRSWVSGSESMPAISATTASVVVRRALSQTYGTGGDAHAVVVTEDGDAGGVRVVELAVDVDDRDAGLHRLEGDRGHRGAVEGQQHDGVDAVVDERLDLADLQVDVVGALGDPQLDVVVLLGRRPWRTAVIAPIQPWSAAGAEKPMTTVSPASSLDPLAAAMCRRRGRRRRRRSRCWCRPRGRTRRARRPGRSHQLLGWMVTQGLWCCSLMVQRCGAEVVLRGAGGAVRRGARCCCSETPTAAGAARRRR